LSLLLLELISVGHIVEQHFKPLDLFGMHDQRFVIVRGGSPLVQSYGLDVDGRVVEEVLQVVLERGAVELNFLDSAVTTHFKQLVVPLSYQVSPPRTDQRVLAVQDQLLIQVDSPWTLIPIVISFAVASSSQHYFGSDEGHGL
jgi:hypothetical protein